MFVCQLFACETGVFAQTWRVYDREAGQTPPPPPRLGSFVANSLISENFLFYFLGVEKGLNLVQNLVYFRVKTGSNFTLHITGLFMILCIIYLLLLHDYVVKNVCEM